MTRPRALFFTRHFWPTISDETLRVQRLARIALAAGIDTSIVTPRWKKEWPRKIVCDDLAVERIKDPPSGSSRPAKYARSILKTLDEARDHYDFIYCDSPDLEASTLLSRKRDRRPPVVVRVGTTDFTGPGRQWKSNSLQVDVCRKADLVVAATASAHQRLLSIGIMNDRILRMPIPVGCTFTRSAKNRTRARKTLSEINHDLFAQSTDRVILCPGELRSEWKILFLFRSLIPLLEDQRSLRLWVLGDGPDRGRIYDTLRHEGLHHVVMMPGVFTDLECLFQAADLCVFPAEDLALGWLVPTCISSQLPFFCASSNDAKSLVGPNATECLFPTDDTQQLEQKLTNWFANPKECERRSRLLAGTASHLGSTEDFLTGMLQKLQIGYSPT